LGVEEELSKPGGQAVSDYSDRWITCDAEAITVRGYYFPWGSKRIPYSSVRGLERVELGTFTGKPRIWGTANLRYWASLDPQRPSKKIGLVLDLGGFVHPFLTPAEPELAEATIRARTGLEATDGGRAPVI
jgi:hypothetical protein